MSDVEIVIQETTEDVQINVTQQVTNVEIVASESGLPGLSAYEIWLTEGNVGTEQDFLNSLAGPNGPRGLSILNGGVDPTPADGQDGEFWINISNNTIFGPKYEGTWPPGTPLAGLQDIEQAYIELRQTTPQNVGGSNGVERVLNWQAESYVADTDFTFSNLNPSQIVFNFTGRVAVKAWLGVQQAGSSRTTLQTAFRINGGATDFMNSHRNYSRGSSYGDISLHWDFEIEVTDGDYIELVVRIDDTDGTYTLNTLPLQNQLIIKRTAIKTAQGPPGLPGSPGQLEYIGIWSPGEYTKNLVVSHYEPTIPGTATFVCVANSTTEEPNFSATDWDVLVAPDLSGLPTTDGSEDTIDAINTISQANFDLLSPKLDKLYFIKG
jgi:hypothetical protein